MKRKHHYIVNAKWKYETLADARACANRIFKRYGVIVAVEEIK